MKTQKILKTFTLLFVMTLVSFSCSDDDDNTPVNRPLNIVETAQANNLNILVQAAIQADLVDALTAAGDKTVLAPTDEAFTTFLANKGFNSLSEVPNDVLAQILLNHVIAGANIESSALIGNTGYTNTLADGPNSTKLSLYYDGTSGVVFNGVSEVIVPDVNTSNGIVHVVDQVIDLPTIATFATSNTALEDLVSALALADTGLPTVNWINTVSGLENADLAPFTVFAPTNTAFDNLLLELDSTGNTGLGDLDASLVDLVLQVHVVADANVQSSQLGSLNGVIPTIGADLSLSGTTITDENNRDINILAPDLVNIQAVNGVVHVIDRVILPFLP